MTDYTPTPEAVEVAARAWHEAPTPQGDGQPGLWADAPDHIKAIARAYMTAALTAAGPLIERETRERVARDILAQMRDDDAWANTCDDYRAAGWDGTPDDYERMFWESAHRAAERIARGKKPR